MTPSALTPAARTTGRRAPADGVGRAAPSRTGPRAASSATAPRPKSSRTQSSGHRSKLRPGLSPRTARRVSGPLGGLTRGRATTTGRPAAQPRRRPARPAAATPRLSLGARAAAFVRALPDHSLLDRIIRGRVWIPLLGVLLAGIVAMQVEVLKLNAATGVSLQRTTALQNARDVLQANVAQLANDQRIETLAAQMGMRMPAPSQVKFLSVGGGTAGLAAADIHPPNATSFLAQLPGAQTTGGLSTGNAPVSAATTDPTATSSLSAPASPGSTAASSAGTATATGTTASSPATGSSAATTVTPATAATPPATGTASPATGTASPATGTASPATGTTAPTQAPTGSSGAGVPTGGVSATPTGG